MRAGRMIVVVSGLCLIGASVSYGQQYPVMEKLAAKIVQKYQSSSCEQLAAEKSMPKNAQKEDISARAVQMMHKDPGMRQAFLNRVAGPIANKMFECGMIP